MNGAAPHVIIVIDWILTSGRTMNDRLEVFRRGQKSQQIFVRTRTNIQVFTTQWIHG